MRVPHIRFAWQEIVIDLLWKPVHISLGQMWIGLHRSPVCHWLSFRAEFRWKFCPETESGAAPDPLLRAAPVCSVNPALKISFLTSSLAQVSCFQVSMLPFTVVWSSAVATLVRLFPDGTTAFSLCTPPHTHCSSRFLYPVPTGSVPLALYYWQHSVVLIKIFLVFVVKGVTYSPKVLRRFISGLKRVKTFCA